MAGSTSTSTSTPPGAPDARATTATTTATASSDDDDGHSTNAITSCLILPTIVYAQFAGTSLWFAPNAVVANVGFDDHQVASLVSSVQGGFIAGTLLLTYFAVADRCNPAGLFAAMTTAGSVLNALCVATTSYAAWIVLRVLVGTMLAGVYPVGMKIASAEYPQGLGARLGVLVGALTLGTAFPWLVRGLQGEGGSGLPYRTTVGVVSAVAFSGALVMWAVMVPRHRVKRESATCSSRSCSSNGRREIDAAPECKSHDEASLQQGVSSGSSDVFQQDEEESSSHANLEHQEQQQHHHHHQQQLMGIKALRQILADSRFRAASLGYFGHMWELYAFWTYVPILIQSHVDVHGVILGNVALTVFATIAIGAASCTIAGIWSLRAGRNVLPGGAVVAEVALLTSLVCCLVAPFYQGMSQGVFLFYLLVWGSAVVADSAQFSSLCAAYACPSLVGTALTFTTCVGFSITIVSIQILGALLENEWDPGNALALLAIGPVLGATRSYWEWPLHIVVC